MLQSQFRFLVTMQTTRITESGDATDSDVSLWLDLVKLSLDLNLCLWGPEFHIESLSSAIEVAVSMSCINEN